jgi:hypothetical protein
MVGLAGLVAAPLIGRAFRELLDRRQTRVAAQELGPRLRAVVIRFAVAATSLTFFGTLYWIALLCVSSGRPVLQETADRLVWAALVWRLLIIILMIVTSPQRADLRLLAIDDTDARVCFREGFRMPARDGAVAPVQGAVVRKPPKKEPAGRW